MPLCVEIATKPEAPTGGTPLQLSANAVGVNQYSRRIRLAETEVLIIGCGIAGATAALQLARNPERQITVITRAPDPHESNTQYAQGGIIGRGLDDDPDILLADILAAGAGVSSPHAARILAEEGPPLLHEVLEKAAGVKFDSDSSGQPLWGNEAAHSRRRILHVGDGTGAGNHEGFNCCSAQLPKHNNRIKRHRRRSDHLPASLSRSTRQLSAYSLSWRLHV